MLDFFYKINRFTDNSNVRNSNLLRKVKTGLYIILQRITNIIIPLIYRATLYKYSINDSELKGKKPTVVISLTSFPARIDYIWICIESLLRQSVKPDEIVLWLAESQFNDIESLPKELLVQRKKGLKIKFCEDLRSHKKYYYAFKEYTNDIVITVDDDIFYPKNTIENLLKLHNKFPKCICCNRGHVIVFDENNVAPYRTWTNNTITVENPTKLLCPTGVGGVLYPPGSIDSEVFNKDSIINLCFFADDLWLKLMSVKNDTSVAKTVDFPSRLFTIISSQKESLSKMNVDEGKNDEQLHLILKKYESFDLIGKIKKGTNKIQ